MRAPCPCGTKKIYMRCCRPLITGKAFAKTAQDLMRSRYTAFVKDKADYLTATCAGKAAEEWKKSSSYAPAVNWIKLEIHQVRQGQVTDEHGEVAFTAFYKTDQASQTQQMYECSVFKKIEGRWYYVDRVAGSSQD